MLDTIPHDYDFPVEMINLEAIKQPAECPDGKFHRYEVPRNMARALVRPDTGAVLGIHGSKYKPINHTDVVDRIMDGIDQCKFGKSTTDIKVYDNGAKMKGTVTFDDLVIEPQLDDIIKFRINFFNSYDATWAFSTVCDGLRLWCMNGCTSPVNASTLRFKHTTNVNINSIAQRIQSANQFFMDSESDYKEWATIELDGMAVQKFLERTVCKTFKRSTNSIPYNVTQVEALLKQYDAEATTLGRTKWALYNALTYWSTHTDHLDRGHTIAKDRETLVAKALTTNDWQMLVA